MSTVDSAVAPTLDEEEVATDHDQVSNDEDHSNDDPSEDFHGTSLSHVGRVFMTDAGLAASPQTDSRQTDSDDETNSSSTNPVSSNDSFSVKIKAHVQRLSVSAEQRLTNIVNDSNSVEDICKGLTFSLPLAQF